MYDPTIASIIANQSKSTDNQNDSSLSTSEPDSIEPVSVESTLVEANPELIRLHFSITRTIQMKVSLR